MPGQEIDSCTNPAAGNFWTPWCRSWISSWRVDLVASNGWPSEGSKCWLGDSSLFLGDIDGIRHPPKMIANSQWKDWSECFFELIEPCPESKSTIFWHYWVPHSFCWHGFFQHLLSHQGKPHILSHAFFLLFHFAITKELGSLITFQPPAYFCFCGFTFFSTGAWTRHQHQKTRKNTKKPLRKRAFLVKRNSSRWRFVCGFQVTIFLWRKPRIDR